MGLGESAPELALLSDREVHHPFGRHHPRDPTASSRQAYSGDLRLRQSALRQSDVLAEIANDHAGIAAWWSVKIERQEAERATVRLEVDREEAIRRVARKARAEVS
jgi:hypothetical protein